MYMSQLMSQLDGEMGHVSNCGVEPRDKAASFAGSRRTRDSEVNRGMVPFLSDQCGRFIGGSSAVILVL